MSATHLFFDIGGVLATNAWGQEQRTLAIAKFALDAAEFDERHRESVGSFESGEMALDEYLRTTVFHKPRAFTPGDFRAFMFAQSKPFPDTIAFVRTIAEAKRWRLSTLNNESAELNIYRLHEFGLASIFDAFFSSCWLGALKPARRIYDIALAISQAEPATCVFVDDRPRNLDAARMLGMQTVLYTGLDRLRGDLAALGVTP